MGAKFVGKFVHSMDTKGRLMIPAKYRAIIGSQTLYILPGLSGNLDAYTEEAFDRFSEKLSELNDITEEEEEAVRMYLADADYVSLDPQGRILLGAAHRARADLVKEAVINGRLDHFEIWCPEKWESMKESCTSEQPGRVQSTIRDLKRRFR